MLKGRRSRSEWQAIMERYGGSGLTQAEFCEREKLSLTSFHKWQQKVSADNGQGKEFVEIPNKVPGCRWSVELELSDGSVFRLQG